MANVSTLWQNDGTKTRKETSHARHVRWLLGLTPARRDTGFGSSDEVLDGVAPDEYDVPR